MMDSSSSRKPLHKQRQESTPNCEKFTSNQIAPSIIGKRCPICLNHIENRRTAVITVCMHAYCVDCIRRWSNLKRKCPLCNANFDSWFFNFNLSSQTFRKEQLPGLNEGKKVNIGDLYGRQRNRLTEQRIIRRSREQLSVSWRTSSVPRRRSFGRLGSVPPDVITERVLQWRASIYDRHLQAVPCSSTNCLEQYVAGKNGVKERILEKIEPWIRRELQAILGDPDPSIIVHVVTSLFISSLTEKHRVSSGQSRVEDYLEPLRPFLLERTNMFWHELRCFAESSFNIETYGTVVEYIKRPK